MLFRILGLLGPIAVARLVSIACALVQLPILTRSLAPFDYALVVAAISTATYLSLIAGDPTTLAFQRFPGSFDDRRPFNYASRRLAGSLAVAALLAAVFALVSGEYDRVVAIVGWGAGLAAMRFISTSWLMWQRPWRYALNLSVSTLLRTATLLTLVLLDVRPLMALGAAGCASLVVAVGLGSKPLWRASALPAKRPWPRRMGISLAIGSLGTTVLQTYDTIIVPGLVDSAQAGKYAAMHQVASLTLTALLGIVTTAFAPVALAHWSAGRQRWTLKLTTLVSHFSSIVGACACGVLLLGADRFIASVLGAEYVDRGLAIMMVTIATLQSMGLQAAWVHRFRLTVNRIRNVSIACAILAVVVTPLAAREFGAMGAATAMLSAHMLFVVAMVYRTGLGRKLVLSAVCLFVAALWHHASVDGRIAWVPLLLSLALSSHFVYVNRQFIVRGWSSS